MFYPPNATLHRFSYSHLPYSVKKFLPQTNEIRSMLSQIKSAGLAIHEHLRHDLHLGKKEVGASALNTCYTFFLLIVNQILSQILSH